MQQIIQGYRFHREMVHAYMLSIVDDYKMYPTNAPSKVLSYLNCMFKRDQENT
jgi:hypothetical protein